MEEEVVKEEVVIDKATMIKNRIRDLKIKLIESKNSLEKAEIAGKIELEEKKLILLNNPELKKECKPIKDAAVIADHKKSRVDSRGLANGSKTIVAI